MLNPFGTTFESLDGPAGPVVESVHQAACQRIFDLIESGEGHLISLRAPRAGYGKTMLLARLRRRTRGKVTMVPVHLAEGQRIVEEGILEEILTQFTENVPAMAGLTRLDLYTRRLFAHGLLPMVYSGEVPCQDKDGAVASLRERPAEVFDFHRKDAVIAQWSKQQFEALSARLASVLSKASGASNRDTAYWIHLFFNFAVRSPQDTSRIDDLMNAIFGSESRFRTGGCSSVGLGAFLNLVTLVEPVVLLLDEVDGIPGDNDAALRVTSKLVSIWESCRRLSVVFSVNDDVWESAFSPRLTAGLRDRLDDVVIRLRSLTLDEASRLISARAGAESVKVIDKLDLSLGDLYPRGVLKAARDVWNRLNEPDGTAEKLNDKNSSKAPAPMVTPIAANEPSDPVVVHQFRANTVEELPGPPLSTASSVEAGDPTASLSGPRPPSLSSGSAFQYPTHPVKRIELPRFFDVQRLRVAPSSPHSNQLVPPGSLQSRFTPASFPGDGAGPESVVHLSKSLPQESPFDAVSGVEEGKDDQGPFAQVPSFVPPQATPGDVSGGVVQESPFEIVRPAPEVPEQGDNPQGDADAIDELLRQFREHREP